MSLRDLGVFDPLKANHPAIGEKCLKCKTIFDIGSRVGLYSIETPEQSGSLTVKAALVCATCYLKGVEVITPEGIRTIERIKSGDASPFPVETTDSKQWRAEEVEMLGG